jgi:hypothetical protein
MPTEKPRGDYPTWLLWLLLLLRAVSLALVKYVNIDPPMIANIGVNILGLFIFLFVFWKKLKDDYVSEIIFSAATLILMGFLVGFLVGLRFLPSWIFWTEFTGILVGLAIAALKYKLRVYESFEAVVISLLPWLSIYFLHDSVDNSSLVSFIAFGVILALIGAYYLFDLKYKNFSWYRSGRVGFSGLATAGLFFLIRSAVAIFWPSVLSFSGTIEPVISGAFAFVAFVLIFNLGRKLV